MTGQRETVEQKLATLLERVHTLARNLAVDGIGNQPGFQHSSFDGLRAAVNEAFRLGRDATAGTGQDDPVLLAAKNTRYVRHHPAVFMEGLHELRHVTGNTAVVLRRDGSTDVYGDVTVIDQAHGGETTR